MAEQLVQRFGRDAVSLLAVTLSQYIAGECTANDFYDMAFDILQGDSEALTSFITLFPRAKRDAVLALIPGASPAAAVSPAAPSGPQPLPQRAPPPSPPGFSHTQGRPQSAQVSRLQGGGAGPALKAPPCSLKAEAPEGSFAQAKGPGASGSSSWGPSAAGGSGGLPRATFSATGRHTSGGGRTGRQIGSAHSASATASAGAGPAAREPLGQQDAFRGAQQPHVSVSWGGSIVTSTSGAGPATPAPTAPGQSASAERRQARKQEAAGVGGGGGPAKPVLMWFRSDLRVADNPALLAAAKLGPVVPVFIYAPQEEGGYPLGGAARLWLHKSLERLGRDLRERFGSQLVLRHAEGSCSSAETLLGLMRETGAETVVFNRVYEPWKLERDARVESAVDAAGGTCQSFCAGVLYEPWDARPDEKDESCWNGGYGSVGFFLRAIDRLGPPPEPVAAPTKLRAPAAWPRSEPLSALRLVTIPRNKTTGKPVDWTTGICQSWGFGEAAAHEALERFAVESGALLQFDSKGVQVSGEHATANRFRADVPGTARISPYLRFGELSPRQVYARCLEAAGGAGKAGARSARVFLRRLAWRDLFYWALWRFPKIPWEPLRPQYDHQWWDHPWDHKRDDPETALGPAAARRRWEPPHAGLKAWQRGETGYPLVRSERLLGSGGWLVDAAMRELWHSGWLPNYLRHVVASFLVEYLGIDWRHGALWFAETLVDADVAINAAMWQNGGHSGLDMWNFVMNPIYAAKSADPEGAYVRKWCPELSKLKGAYVHAPWEAPATARAAAGIVLGRTYPRPIVQDLEAALRRSLRAVNEVLILPDGRKARLITRKDFRQGAEIPITRQTAAAEWDPRRRTLGEDAMARTLREEVALCER